MPLVDDLNAADPAAVEQAAKSGGLVPEGLYHAVLAGCRSGTANSGTEFRELTFRLLGGPWDGSEIEHSLFLPNTGQEADKKKKSDVKLRYFMHRLGITKKVKRGDKEVYEYAGDARDFSDRLGAECVVEVQHEEEHWQDKKTGADRKMMKAKVSYMGVFTWEHDAEKCKAVKKGVIPAGGLSGLVGAGMAAGAAGGDDYSDL